MSDTFVELLRVLIKRTIDLYQDASADRKLLHQSAWVGEEDFSLILGELEVRSADVAGIAERCVKDKTSDDTEALVSFLIESSVFASEPVAQWVCKRGDQYPRFLQYIHAVESLRMATIVYLNEM